MQTEKTKILPTWALIASMVTIGTIAILGYFLATRDSKGIENNSGNANEIEGRVQSNERGEMEIEDNVIVIFEDEILENLIREELSIPTEEITSEDMLALYSLNIAEIGVTNLKGLEYALGLDSFSLSKENVESLEPLKNLSNLNRLTIRYSTIENLPIEFSQDVNFSHVSIVNTPIEDISFLAHMTNIEHLTMSDASIKDIKAVENLNNVKQLNLRGNEIEDLSALRGKNNLEILNLQSNQISDITPLSELQRLDNLVLSFNLVSNLKPLENLSSLSTLVIHLEPEARHLIRDQVGLFENKGVEVDYSR